MRDLSRKSWDCRFSVKRGQDMNCRQNIQPSLVSTAMLCYYYIRSDWDSKGFKLNFHQFFIVGAVVNGSLSGSQGKRI